MSDGQDLTPFSLPTLGEFMERLSPDDPPDHDEYRGGSGWVLVAEGPSGSAVVIEAGPGFGAMRFQVDEVSNLCDEIGLAGPGSPGVFRARAKIVHSVSYEGEHDYHFKLLTEWQEITPGVEPAAAFEWEPLCGHDDPSDVSGVVTSRAPVPGGWIYRTVVVHGSNRGVASVACGMTFVPEEVTRG